MSSMAVMTGAEQSAHFLDRRHDGAPEGPLKGPSVWKSSELGPEDNWFEVLPPELIAAFEAVMDRVRGRALDNVTSQDVRLPDWNVLTEQWRQRLQGGPGFLLLRGVPVERWSLEDQKLFMRVLGLQFGRLGYNNPQGDVIGEVCDRRVDVKDPFARLYATASEFRFHCDASDLVGLMCVRQAFEGGESRIASSAAVYNEVLARRPDLAGRLFQPMAFDLRNEHQPGQPPYASIQPCAYSGGLLKTFYLSDYFWSAGRHIPLPDEDVELLELYDTVAADPDISIAFRLRPGDVQILNNHATLHARTAFQDRPGEERLLLRFLVSVAH